MGLKDHLGNFNRILPGSESEVDFELSAAHSTFSMGYHQRYKTHELNLQEVNKTLTEKLNLDLEQALRREYDRDSFSEREKGFITASRNYAMELIEDVRNELPAMRARSNHASFEGAEYSIPEEMQENEEYLEELGLI